MATCSYCKTQFDFESDCTIQLYVRSNPKPIMTACHVCVTLADKFLKDLHAPAVRPPLFHEAIDMVDQMRKLGADYTDQEMRDAWLTFEAGKREDGRWSWGRGTIPPGDARAALESRMQDLRARRAPALDESKVFWMNKEKLALVQKEIDAIKVRGSVTANGTTYSEADGTRLRALVVQKKELKAKLNL